MGAEQWAVGGSEDCPPSWPGWSRERRGRGLTRPGSGQEIPGSWGPAAGAEVQAPSRHAALALGTLHRGGGAELGEGLGVPSRPQAHMGPFLSRLIVAPAMGRVFRDLQISTSLWM